MPDMQDHQDGTRMSDASETWGQRFARGLMNAVLVVYVLVCAIILFVDRNVTYSMSGYNTPLLPNLALVAIAAVIALLCQKMFTLRKASDAAPSPVHRTGRAPYIFATAALFCYQLVSFYYVGVLTGWDAGTLRGASTLAAPISQTLPADDWYYLYFSSYPNNLLMLIIFRVQDRIRAALMPQVSTGVFYAVISMALVSLSFYLFTRVSAKLFGRERRSLVADGIFFVLVGLSPWYMIPYSDTYGLFMCTVMLYLLVCHSGSLPSAVALGLLGAVAYSIKPTCVFVIISICVAWVLETCGTAAFRKAISDIGVMLLAFVISLAAVNMTIGSLGISWNEDARITASHFAMMGLNDETDGVFSSDDASFSMAQPNVEAREEANREVIKERLNAYGPIGLAKHLVKKTLVCFNDGMFAWPLEGGFFGETVGVASDDGANFFHNYLYPPASFSVPGPYRTFCTIEQTLWLVCLIGIPLGLLRPEKRHYPEKDASDSAQPAWLVIAYCVGAMLLFLLVFEARARYLYLYSGYFVLLGMHGYQQARARLATWSESRPRRLATPRSKS